MHRTDDRTGLSSPGPGVTLDPAAPVEAWPPCECGRPVCPDPIRTETPPGPAVEVPAPSTIAASVARPEPVYRQRPR